MGRELSSQLRPLTAYYPRIGLVCSYLRRTPLQQPDTQEQEEEQRACAADSRAYERHVGIRRQGEGR